MLKRADSPTEEESPPPPLSVIKAIRPEGSYLVWLDCRALGMSVKELREWMIGRAKVGLNDGCLFGSGGEGFQRINIACPLPVLMNALERIKQAVKSR